ncbi:hypothetical protein MMC25_003599 [Agyrium rufum]|nr:hypothetical protein [Agyrium rufum]
MSTTPEPILPSHNNTNGETSPSSLNDTTKPATSAPLTRRVRTHLLAHVHPTYTSLPLLISCVVSGLLDSAAYNAYSTFISMQTGNTIFLALGASQQPATRPFAWLRSLVSIACFALGCFSFASSARYLGGRRRGVLSLGFALQALFIAIAGVLVEVQAVPTPRGVIAPAQFLPQGDNAFVELAPIALLAFQAGGQIVASRVLGIAELPTTVLTSVYCDIASDPRLFGAKNRKRDRRVGGVLCLLLGGIVGGWISRSEGGFGAVIWVACGLKALIAGAWLLWKEEPPVIEGNAS